MADEVDVANEYAARQLAYAIASVKSPTLVACGHCYYCDSPVNQGVNFCDSLCRNDYDTEQRLLKQAGRA